MDTTIVGIVGVLIGILLTNALTMVLEWRRRRERIRDVQTSLRAEIRSHWLRLPKDDLDAMTEEMVARIREAREAGRDFTPFIPRQEEAIVFRSMVGEIHILPNHVIDPVVLYYTHQNVLGNFVEDMRSERYARLEPERKIAIYRDYIAMLRQLRELADEAIEAIAAAMESGEDQ